jgi:aryl-alcohol dehydrogenase-like predicted oxidoreductase
MKMRFLGKTGIQVSELCLGTADFGSTGIYAKTGNIGQREADFIVSMALDMGINFFNTAETYSNGNAEEILGKALGKRRKDAIIITKVDSTRTPGLNDGGLSRHHIINGCEASLKRLGTDYIDIYELHRFDPLTPLEVTLRALDDLVRQGKVRYIGCSNFSGWQLMKALAISGENGWERFVTLEAMYSLASRWLEFELVPLCLDQGLGIIAFSPLHGGFLSGKYRRDQPWPAGTRFDNLENTEPWPVEPEKLFDIVEELEKIARDHGVTVSQTALNYLLGKPGVNSLIIGIRTAKQLEENIGATGWQITPEEVARLDKISEPRRRYPYYIYNPVDDEPASID